MTYVNENPRRCNSEGLLILIHLTARANLFPGYRTRTILRNALFAMAIEAACARAGKPKTVIFLKNSLSAMAGGAACT